LQSYYVHTGVHFSLTLSELFVTITHLELTQ
jgi:hypothetical protein